MSIQRTPCFAPARIRDHASEVVLFKALADTHRLAILEILANREMPVCVCDFTSVLPLNQPTVSHHLRILKAANLITAARRGTWVYYSLADAAPRLLADAVSSILSERQPA